MTREELKKHCEKQIEMCEMWAIAKGEKPSGKVYEEHKLILELLEQQSEDTISRQAAIYLADELKHDLPDDERLSDMVMAHNEGILDYQTKLSLLPSVQPKTEIKPIGYRECADATLKMWMDNVLTDGEHYRIMNKLNAKWSKMNEVTK